MTSRQLSQVERQSIVQRAIKHGFESREKALKVEELKICKAIRIGYYGAAAVRCMDRLPDKWLPVTDCLRVEMGAIRPKFDAGAFVRVPVYDHGMYIELEALPEDLQRRIKQHVATRDALDTQKTETRRQLVGVLNGFRTLPAILKAWPELQPFCVDIDQSTPNQLAIPRERLNLALGITA